MVGVIPGVVAGRIAPALPARSRSGAWAPGRACLAGLADLRRDHSAGLTAPGSDCLDTALQLRRSLSCWLPASRSACGHSGGAAPRCSRGVNRTRSPLGTIVKPNASSTGAEPGSAATSK